MNIATVCSNNENFIYYLRTMLYSLKYSGFDKDITPVYIFTDGFKDGEVEQLRKLWNIKIKVIDGSVYPSDKQHPKFMALETFNQNNYDNLDDVLFLDADLIIKKDITDIKNYFSQVTMVRELNRSCFNSGVVCVPKSRINPATYSDMLGYKVDANVFGNDQQVFNGVLKGTISTLPNEYNSFVNGEYDHHSRIAHYILKPDRDDIKGRINKLAHGLWKRTLSEVNQLLCL